MGPSSDLGYTIGWTRSDQTGELLTPQGRFFTIGIGTVKF